MNSWLREEQIRRLLKLLANPLTISVLCILVGVDPGRISKEVLLGIIGDSWESPDEDTMDHTEYGIY